MCLVRDTAREHHTRFGWWVMTHDRGGAAVIGGGALVVLVADAFFAATRWNGSFPRSFLISAGGLVVVAVVSLALRLARPIGADRRRDRWNQQSSNFVLVAVLVLLLVFGDRFGGNGGGEVSGSLAALAVFFVVMMGRELLRHRA